MIEKGLWEFSAFKKSKVAVVPAELEKKDGEIDGGLITHGMRSFLEKQ